MKNTRREFLQGAMRMPLAAALGWPTGRLFAAESGSAGWKRFEKPDIVRYDADCFTVNNQDTFLFGAEFHYPRCPRELWHDRFLKLRRAQFNTVQTMVFWNYHEREQGHFDFTEFEEFLKLAEEMGFWVSVRPGPYICAEFERAGFPRWVIAEHLPLRSMHPESLRTSQYWYDRVLPIIARNQITNNGPIIMMQLENEYDYWRLPDPEKREYIRFLARLAWDAGINVPLFTNWTSVVRDQADPDMDRIMDTCDFYPRWGFLKEIRPAIAKLRKEQTVAPLSITELQGGWFAQIGGKLSVDQEGVDAAQLNALTKSVMEMGVTSFNYYMGYGGTNFDWAAKTLTTTYDYAAPIREPGGLWEKYYAARGIGEFLKMFGTLLTRAEPSKQSCQCTNSDVSISERTSGASGVLFVRANTESEHHFRMTFPDPRGTGSATFTVPREGEIVLGPNEMKTLPVCVPVAGGQLIYTSAEVLAHGANGDRHFLIIYDEPGRVAEIALEASHEPRVTGQTLYQYWDQNAQTVATGLEVRNEPSFLSVDSRLLIIVIPRDLALRTWLEELSSDVVPASKGNIVPFITDAYLLRESGSEPGKLWAEFKFLPGIHSLDVLLPSRPSACRVAEEVHNVNYDPQWRTARTRITTPPLAVQSIDLRQVQSSVDLFDARSGHWTTTPARPLEEIGPVPYGYVKYRGHLIYSGEPRLYVSALADDGKRLFINGKDVPEAASPELLLELDASRYLEKGVNTVEIACEVFGAPNGGDNLGELKGIDFVRAGTDPRTGPSIETWQIQAFPAAMRDLEVDPHYAFGNWQEASVGDKSA